MRKFVLSLICPLLILLLSACAPAQVPIIPTAAPTAAASPTSPATPTELPSPTAVASSTAAAPPIEIQHPTVAILVVDSFIQRNDEEPIQNETGTANCLLIADGQGYVSSGGSSSVHHHGAYVLETVTSTLEHTFGANQKQAGSQTWYLGGQNGASLLVVPVDIGAFETETVSQRILETMAVIYDHYQISRFVVNMSWVILATGDDQVCRPEDPRAYLKTVCAGDVRPLDELDGLFSSLLGMSSAVEFCANLADVEDDVDKTDLLRHAEIAITYNNPEYIGEFVQYVEATDPIAQLFDCLQAEPERRRELACSEALPQELRSSTELYVIPIAAAGNSGLDFPYMPGYWDSVISVSASDALDPASAIGYTSNRGELSRIGTHPAGVGSSFAAPRLSARAAVYLLLGGTSPCQGRPDMRPVLGYMPGVIGAWDNLAPDVVASSNCPDWWNLLTGYPIHD